MDEVVLTKFYVYNKIYKVLNSCTNRFQYITAVKYLGRLIDRLTKGNHSIHSINVINRTYSLYKQHILQELNE